MKAPKNVSILIPSLNCDQELQKVITQILVDQTLDGESIFVVIDGGFTQSDVVEFLQSKGVNVMVSKERGGVALALNSGLERIRSQYVRRMDADDEWIIGSLNSKVLNLLENHSLVFGYAINKKNGKYFKSSIPDLPEGEISRFAFLPGNPITHPAVCFEAQHIATLGGYSQFASAEDFELWMRLLLCGYSICNTDLPTVVYSREKNLASGKLVTQKVLEEVQDAWLNLVGNELELTASYLNMAICRNVECGHVSSDIRKYKKDLSRTLKKLRTQSIHPRLYINIFIRSIITLFAHDSRLKTVGFCLGESLMSPKLVPTFLAAHLIDRWKLVMFKKSIAHN
jgi:glycosyltransferase involved in cell wall biosynthesis